MTQLIDPVDPVLGFTVGLVRALAAQFERIAVIANEMRSSPLLPANVEFVSLGKERGAGRLVRGARFQRELLRLLRDVRPDAFLAHMCPEYLVLAAPLAKWRHVSTLLWFAHPADSARLARAERLADVVLTSLPGSFPRRSSKVRVIGQAIDCHAFAQAEPPDRAPDEPLRLLALGRTSDSKRYDVAVGGISAARKAGTEVTLRVVGPSTTPAERANRETIERSIAALGLEPFVRLEPGVTPAEVPALLVGCDGLLNTTIDGSGDKVVLEAMSAGRPVLVSNPAFADLVSGLGVPLSFPTGDEKALGGAISTLAGLDRGTRSALGTELRERVLRGHSIDHWAESIGAVVEELRQR